MDHKEDRAELKSIWALFLIPVPNSGQFLEPFEKLKFSRESVTASVGLWEETTVYPT